MKKGVISIQFNWIFIIIAGAVILLFFFSIVQWQKKSSESKINVAVLTNLDAIFTGAQTAESSTNLITIPDTEIKFDCSNYYIGTTTKPILGRTIFTPNLIRGTKILTHSLSWNVPFKVTNLLYLTSPQIRYILVEDSTIPVSKNFLSEIDKSLPPKYMTIQGNREIAMNKEVWEKSALANVQDENNYKIKFIFFNTDYTDSALANLQDMPNKDVTAIEIKDSNEINFYQKQGSTFFYQGTSYYFGNEAIIGAIFAENPEMYDCSIQKAFKKLMITSKIYHNRSYDLMNYYENIPRWNCRNDHFKASAELDTISGHAESISAGSDVKNEIDRLLLDLADLQQENDNAQLHSCALVY
jgi:hypothetical protein